MDINKFLHLLRQRKEQNIDISQGEIDLNWAKFRQSTLPKKTIDTSFLKGFAVAAVVSLIIWFGYNMWNDKKSISNNTNVLNKLQTQIQMNGDAIDINKIQQLDPVITKKENGNDSISIELPEIKGEVMTNKNDDLNNFATQEMVAKYNFDPSRSSNKMEKPNSTNSRKIIQSINAIKTSTSSEDIKNDNAVFTRVNNESIKSDSLTNYSNPIKEGVVPKTEDQKELVSDKHNEIENEEANIKHNLRSTLANVYAISQVKGNLLINKLSMSLSQIKIKSNAIPKWSIALESNKSIGSKNANASGRLFIARDLGQRYRLSVGFGLGKNIGFTNEIPRKWPMPGHAKPFHEISWRSNYIELPARLQYKLYRNDKWQILAGPQVSINILDHHDANYVFKGSDGVRDEQKVRIDENVSFQYGIALGADRQLYKNWNLNFGFGIMHQNNSRINAGFSPNLNLGLQYKF